jgi:hypothetical protein
MMTRDDIHRPSAIDPADYTYVGSFINDPPYTFDGDLACDPSELADYPQEHLDGACYGDLLHPNVSPDRPRMHFGQCDHCGAYIRYCAIYRHNPSGQYMVTGHDCADNTMGWDGRRSLELARQKKAMAASRKNAKEQEERLANINATRELFPAAVDLLMNYEGHNSFIQDVASRFTRWGTTKRITDGDYSAQSKVMMAVLNAHQRDKERAEEKAQAADVPEGRQVIEGQVLSVKDYDGDFGTQWKMLVKADEGWTVFGTVPRALTELPNPASDSYWDRLMVERGQRVRFTATIKVSRKDRTHGYYSRPAKAEIVD